MPYNIISCSGWDQASGYVAAGGCMKARIGLVILFFILAIIRKWGGEEIGVEFSFLFGLLLGLLCYILLITIFGSFVLAFIIGLIAGLIGGYGGGIFFGGGEY